MTDQNEAYTGYRVRWDEDNLRWLGIKYADSSNYRWDADNKNWIAL